MSAFKPFPEAVLEEDRDSSAARVVTSKGDVLLVDSHCDTAVLERFVECWNALRKIAFPAAHLSATDDYVTRVEKLRKEATAKTGPAAEWSMNLDEAPLDRRLWLATKCGKVSVTRWNEKRGAWDGLASGEQPIAWQVYAVPEHPNQKSDADEFAAVKGDARLANATSVEPSVSGLIVQLDNVGGSE